ncbi:UNVERIFIED_CONTAM: hypothetical protein Slati_0231500 [Sesamum latifolium]|uniref:Uncharacterized protein n=1 Tax=Sesamum latifolium TaxID=2727402 RepID=A0AAW2YCP1_9LAMI
MVPSRQQQHLSLVRTGSAVFGDSGLKQNHNNKEPKEKSISKNRDSIASAHEEDSAEEVCCQTRELHPISKNHGKEVAGESQIDEELDRGKIGSRQVNDDNNIGESLGLVDGQVMESDGMMEPQAQIDPDINLVSVPL